MQALKALVIFMGVLIVAGMALLVYGLVTRSGDGETGSGGAPAAAGFGALESRPAAASPAASCPATAWWCASRATPSAAASSW